jgi:tetratricopeptide (TPR) repeat protein
VIWDLGFGISAFGFGISDFGFGILNPLPPTRKFLYLDTTKPKVMKKLLALVALVTFFSSPLSAQKEKNKKTLSAEESKALLDKTLPDSSSFLKSAGHSACNCIDSVDKAEKDRSKKMAAFSNCIDREVGSYQLASKLLTSMKTSNNKIEVALNDKNSTEYKRYYYDIESWLKDSCVVLNRAIATNDEENENSMSKNADALDAYTKGVAFLKVGKYEEAAPFFRQAVTIDSVFAFAWDNLGICYRRTGKYDEAEAAYKASLRMDPLGKTALQNLAVVYQLKNDMDKAAAIYTEYVDKFPEDPEGFYGLGLIYLGQKKDLEKALDNMCKAYKLYAIQKSAYRADAEKAINSIYSEMKKQNREEEFNRILKANNISQN